MFRIIRAPLPNFTPDNEEYTVVKITLYIETQICISPPLNLILIHILFHQASF
jgi:hypothetical protein